MARGGGAAHSRCRSRTRRRAVRVSLDPPADRTEPFVSGVRAGLAGLDAERIDGGVVANALGMAERQGHLGPLIMTSLGIPEKPMSSIEAACASGASTRACRI
mgnify:CR=1 FL=1